jgi:hypothetical protein
MTKKDSEKIVGALILGFIILCLFSLVGMCTPDLEDPEKYYYRKLTEQVEERVSPKDFWNIK